MSIFTFYKLENSKNGHYLVKDLVTFYSALLPMLSLTPSMPTCTEQALSAYLCCLGDRQ